MKNLIKFIMVIGLLSLGGQAKAGCLVEMNKSDFLLYEGSVLVEKKSGHFQEFASEFIKAGYDICLGSECKGQVIDISFRAVLSTMLEKNVLPFGYSKGEYFTALSMSINETQTTNSFTSSDIKSTVKKAQSILKKLIPKCNID